MSVSRSHADRDYTMGSAFVWLLFEYLLTLDQEVELFWGQKVTAASILFFSNRYLPLLCSAWWTPWWRYKLPFEMYVVLEIARCVAQQLIGGIGEYLLFIPVSAFSAMRAYALASSYKRTWGIIVFLLSLSPAIFALPHGYASFLIPMTSVEKNTRLLYYSWIWMVSTRFSLVLADLVVLCITWLATYKHRNKTGYPRISDILFRDGTIYFVAQLLLNTFYLISILLPPDIFDAQDLNSIASVYVQPATSILITHFLLDLQQASRRAMYLPAMHTENWEKVMGSLVLVAPENEEDCDALVRDVRTPC